VWRLGVNYFFGFHPNIFKHMKKLLFSLLVAFCATSLFISCKDEEETPKPKNIVELAQGDANLSTLVAALTRADLVTTLNGAGPFTVFAPTNAAFNEALKALGFAKLEDVPVPTLKSILLYHVVSGDVRAAQVTTGYVNSLSPFGTSTNNMSLFLEKGTGVKINKDVTVTTADVVASNGVVHVVDKVIVPPTVVNTALNNPNFSSLVAALTRADLGVNYVQILSGTGPFTVFAPTNDAFKALLEELKLPNLAAIPVATLNAVLQYHVVKDANVRSAQLSNGQQVTTFGGSKFTVNTTGGAKITDAKGRVSNIISVDVQSANGVVHAIDKVILP
jgi:uncharacterized surface protein with fasciclin (FAS1) repeats